MIIYLKLFYITPYSVNGTLCPPTILLLFFGVISTPHLQFSVAFHCPEGASLISRNENYIEVFRSDWIAKGVPRGAAGGALAPPPRQNFLLGRTELGSLAERNLTV